MWLPPIDTRRIASDDPHVDSGLAILIRGECRARGGCGVEAVGRHVIGSARAADAADEYRLLGAMPKSGIVRCTASAPIVAAAGHHALLVARQSLAV